jgi:carbamoyl-phosphate synthase large subunit
MINVLVTSTNTVSALNVLRSLLARKDVELFSTDLRNMSSGLVYTKNHFKVSHAMDKNYIQQMLSISIENNIRYIFPVSDAECKKLAKNKHLFDKVGTKILSSNYNIVELCCDKLKTYDFLKMIGIKTPLTWAYTPKNTENFPIVLRTRYAGTKRKALEYLLDEVDYNYHGMKIKSEKVLSGVVEGREFTIDVLSDMSGKVIKVSPRERTYVLNGNTKIGTIVHSEKMVKEVSKIAEGLGLVGITCIQCISNNTGNHYFEINPRVGSGLDLTIKSGLDFPSMLIDINEGKDISHLLSKKPKDKLTMIRYQDCIII